MLKDIPVPVEDWMRMGLALKVYEHAPESAQEFFGKRYESDKEIEQDFLRKTDQKGMASTEAQRIGTGYTYRVFQHYCETGETGRAQQFLDTLIDGDVPISHLAALAQGVGIDYKEISLSAGRLIRASELDHIAFTKNAPHSAERSHDYGESDQLIVVYKSRSMALIIGKGTSGLVPYGPERVVATSYIPRKEWKDGVPMPVMSQSVRRSLNRKKALDKIRTCTAEYNPQKPLIIDTNAAMELFLGQRFFTIKAGECAEEGGMKLDTALKF